MKTQRVALVLTIINLVILLSHWRPFRPALAESALPVLRGRGLEIVDQSGKLRAQLILTAPTTMPDGQKYDESVLLRLIDRNGRPGVKIGTGVDGSGISIAGDSERREWNGVQILAKAEGSSVKLTNKDGHQRVVQP